MIRIVLAIAIAALGVACTPRTGGESEEAIELRLYEVDSSSVFSAMMTGGVLEELLAGLDDEQRLARVGVLPNGRIAVSAPASVHAGVERLIEEMATSDGSAPRTVRIRQWLIEGTPAETTAIDDRVGPLQPSLARISESSGPLAFEQLDHVEHVVLEDARSAIQGRLLDSKLRARSAGDRIQLDVEIGTPALGSIDTELGVLPGEYVVLANIERPLGDEQRNGNILVFVIQAEFL